MATTVKEEKNLEANPFENMDFVSLSKEISKEKEKIANKNAMKLIRVRISCNNPNKRNYECEIFTVQNAELQVKKCVPFNVPTHIPMILYNAIDEKKCTIFIKDRNSKIGNSKVKLIKEYNIEVLPPLTNEELEAIKQKQLAEQGQDS